jgi:hypothetical protein
MSNQLEENDCIRIRTSFGVGWSGRAADNCEAEHGRQDVGQGCFPYAPFTKHDAVHSALVDRIGNPEYKATPSRE